MPDTTVVIGIGRATDGRHGPGPLTDTQWVSFQRDIASAIAAYDGTLYFAGTGDGVYENVPEESATFVASAPRFSDQRNALLERLALLARAYEQESIAVTFGETRFVVAAA